MKHVHDTIMDHFERASNYLWTGDDRNWIQGMNFSNNRTIIETQKILLDMEADENSHVKKDDKNKDESSN